MSSVRARLTAAFKVLALFGAAALVACGGDENKGGGGGLSYGVSVSPIPQFSTNTFRSIVSSSNGAGSITVGGQSYNIATAFVTENGTASTVAAVRAGSLVTLTMTNGIISSVDVAPVFSGPITAVNVAGQTFTGLGQTIRVDSTTLFTGTSLATLTSGNVVTVRGYIQSPGVLYATRIDLVSTTLAPGGRIYAAGIAQVVNPTGRSFNLGNSAQGGPLAVNYSGATNTNSLFLTENTPVVASSTTAPLFGSFQFNAQEVIAFNGTQAQPSTTFPGSGSVGLPGSSLVHGIVTSSSGFGQITVGAQTYTIGSATVTEGGRTATSSAIRTGSLVTINSLNGNVSSVEIHTLFTGPLESVNAFASSMSGFGQTIRVDGSTFYNGRQLANLTVGNVVTVSGYLQSGQIFATRVDFVSDALTFNSTVSVAGTTQFVNVGARTFNLGALNVNYTNATPAVTTLVDNTPVVVSSTTAPTFGGPFNATQLTVFSGTLANNPGGGIGGTNTVLATGIVDAAVLPGSNVVSVLGIPFTVSASTIYTNSAQPGVTFNLTTLPARAKVQVSATPSTFGGQYSVTQMTLLSLTDDGQPASLSAPLTAVANPNMSISTLQITTNFSTQFTVSNATSDINTFFSRATVGSYVTINGTYNFGVLNATRVSL